MADDDVTLCARVSVSWYLVPAASRSFAQLESHFHLLYIHARHAKKKIYMNCVWEGKARVYVRWVAATAAVASSSPSLSAAAAGAVRHPAEKK